MPFLTDDLDFIDLDDASSDSNDTYLPSDESRSATPDSSNTQAVAPIKPPSNTHGSATELCDQESDEVCQGSAVGEEDSRNDTATEDQSVVSSDEVDKNVHISKDRIRTTRSLSRHATTDKQEFSNKVHELEPEADLQLLYPPSLWQQRSYSGLEADNQDLTKIFPLPAVDEMWTELELDEFCVYNGLNHKKYPGQYESLHIVASEQGKRSYLLDGIARSGGHVLPLERMEIVRVSIGGLDLGCHSCEGQYWVQTRQSANIEGWFKLKAPAAAYATIWSDFVWIANFAKYCVDYLLLAEEQQRSVTITDFRSDFVARLIQQHQSDELNDFQKWLRSCGNNPDLRRQLAQFGMFVYDVCYTTPDLSVKLKKHPVWKEIGCFAPGTSTNHEQTTVTRNTATTFSTAFPRWGSTELNLLQESDCEPHVELQRQERMRTLRLPDKFGARVHDDFLVEDNEQIPKVERILQEASARNRSTNCPPEQLVNKLVVVRQIENKATHFDFAYVYELSNNRRFARVVWLTVPLDTICAKPSINSGYKERLSAHYPIGNELFFSDDCNCFAVHVKDIVGVYDIKVLQDIKGGEFFATTLYLEQDESFVGVTEEQLRFMCRTRCARPQSSSDRTPNGTYPRKPRSTGSSHDQESTYQERLHCEELTNLSLFTGCGLFDRALESTGKLFTTMSIDCNAYAICSAQANSLANIDHGADFVVDSVNTELEKIMKGYRAYPKPGCLSAGCPCPGFSVANYNKDARRSQLDCTLLASTMSWIEVTLPAYVVIENVPHMDTGSPSACSQAVSFLVALGYQVRKAQLRATDFGGSTIRTRLFILAAAPAVKLPERPRPTHGDEPLMQRVIVEDAISDLESIHNDTLVNIKSPYHTPLMRLSPNITTSGINYRDMLHRIPTSPSGQGLRNSLHLMNAIQKGWIQRLHHAKQATNSQAIRRVEAKGFFKTVLTSAHWQCANGGQLIHYDQDRLLSLEEVARAQGVPRDFILIGSTAQKLKQVGNAVPWCLREAIGREIAKAYACSRPLETKTKQEKVMKGGAQTESEDDELVFSTKEEFEKILHQRALLIKETTTNKTNILITKTNDTISKLSLRQEQRTTIELDVKQTQSANHGKRCHQHIMVDDDSDSDPVIRPPINKRARFRANKTIMNQAGRIENSSDEDEAEHGC